MSRTTDYIIGQEEAGNYLVPRTNERLPDDYQAHLDQPAPFIPCWETWNEGLEQGVQQTNERGQYEYNPKNSN